MARACRVAQDVVVDRHRGVVTHASVTSRVTVGAAGEGGARQARSGQVEVDPPPGVLGEGLAEPGPPRIGALGVRVEAADDIVEPARPDEGVEPGALLGRKPSLRCWRFQLTTSSGAWAMLKSPMSRSRPAASARRREASTWRAKPVRKRIFRS